jgi:hypothetical protein
MDRQETGSGVWTGLIRLMTGKVAGFMNTKMKLWVP